MQEKILELIPVSQIIEHWDLNRDRNDLHVDALAKHIDEDGYNEEYPISVVRIGDDFHLAAGHHRLAAAKTADLLYPTLPLERIPALVIEGGIDDVVRIIHEDNFKHDPALNSALGMPLSRDQKKEQCKQLLQFPEYWEQSDERLSPIFGAHSATVGRWRADLTPALQECARKIENAEMSEDTLFEAFGLTPERLEQLISLIKSGKRIGADGRITYTQAGADKKEDARAKAVQTFQESHRAVISALSDIHIECPSLKREYVKGRLYAHFDLAHEANASRWSTEKLAKQQKAISLLRSELLDRDASRWCEEFRRLEKVKSPAAELRALSRPFLTAGPDRILEEVSAVGSDDFEKSEQARRLEILSNLARRVREVLGVERAARAENLQDARSAANSARDSLLRSFRERALQPDAFGQSFRDFISCGLEIPKDESGYSDKLSVEQFLNPNCIDVARRAWAVQNICARMGGELKSEEPPKWMRVFLKSPVSRVATSEKIEEPSAVETPIGKEQASDPEPSGPEPPPRATSVSDGNDQASASIGTEARVSNADFDLINLQPSAGASAGQTSEKSESENAPVETALQKSENENAEDAVGARASGADGNSDLKNEGAGAGADTRVLERDLQAADDAVTAILPPGERGRGDVVSHISEKVFKEKALSPEERLAVLRDLIRRDLQVLQTARLTKR